MKTQLTFSDKYGKPLAIGSQVYGICATPDIYSPAQPKGSIIHGIVVNFRQSFDQTTVEIANFGRVMVSLLQDVRLNEQS